MTTDPVSAPPQSSASWLPFTTGQLQIVLGTDGFAATVLTVLGMPASTFLSITAGYDAFIYLAPLRFSRCRAEQLAFLRDGVVGGAGSLESLRRVRRCLQLMHLDDDNRTQNCKRSTERWSNGE